MAVRKKWNTMIILVKDVITISIAGARLNTVSRAIICRAIATSLGDWADSALKVTEGIGRVGPCCGNAVPVIAKTINNVNIAIFFLLILTSPQLLRMNLPYRFLSH